MGISSRLKRLGAKAADKVADLSALSPEQLQQVEEQREKYLSEQPDLQGAEAEEITARLMATAGVEIYSEYLSHIKDYYVPMQRTAEYENEFNSPYNIRYYNITKWVTDKKENGLEKLVNVYEVLSDEECNIALIFRRRVDFTEVYIAVTNTENAQNNVDVENYGERLMSAIKGNFPGAEWSDKVGKGEIPFLGEDHPFSVACASNIPGEKSEKFVSQTIEKLLDGIIPECKKEEYTLILLATPINDVETKKLHLSQLYTALAPYSAWQTGFTYTEADSKNSMATFGVNAGVSAGVQHGQNSTVSQTNGVTNSESQNQSEANSESETETNGESETDSTSKSSGETDTDSYSESEQNGYSHTKSVNVEAGVTESASVTGGVDIGPIKGEATGGISLNQSISKGASDAVNYAKTVATSKSKAKTLTDTLTKAATKQTSKAVSQAVTKTIGQTLGKAVSKSVTTAQGVSKATNLGGNFGANFARSSNVSITIGKNESVTQSFTNYTIKHTMEVLETQMKRLEQSTALGMWDFAAYVLSEDQNVANNVAHSYLALTEGEQSFMSNTAVNSWRGDMGDESAYAKEICGYLRELRHPLFGLSPALTTSDSFLYFYPSLVDPATSLSGKELAYALNFPQKSVAGFPVLECAEFGRNIVSYGSQKEDDQLRLGNIFHMNHEEEIDVLLNKKSLTSHVFITGSTGSGKSNTVYQLLDEALEQDVKFLVIEPAKGEYKNVFGNERNVSVYGTNPFMTPMLRINPFSFPEKIHIFEHLDRLVEIFNVCWPMYAAMPAVLKNAIEKSYEDCGWDLIRSTNKYGRDLYPTFSDVARNIRTIIDSSEYDNENKGAYKGSLLTRLQSLTNGINGTIFVSDEISAKDLFDKNVIVDLSRVGSSETKSLIMGMLVLKLQEYRMTSAGMNSNLKHLTVLEEAHNILRRTAMGQSEEGGNLTGKSVEMLSNAIAEMRTYGEGFIIVDQAPGLLDMSAIRNTNTKIIMRLPDQEDRELVGRAANLNDDQITELAKLPCGVAAVYQNEWIQPVLCKVQRYDGKEEAYRYNFTEEETVDDGYEDRIQIAEMLSKGMTLGQEVSRSYVVNTLKELHASAYVTVSVLKLLQNPPKEPNMTNLAPIMNELFPEIKASIKASISNEADVSDWTREANDILLKYQMDDQVRRDIIQGTITYYLINETNNRGDLENWIQRGGLR